MRRWGRAIAEKVWEKEKWKWIEEGRSQSQNQGTNQARAQSNQSGRGIKKPGGPFK